MSRDETHRGARWTRFLAVGLLLLALGSFAPLVRWLRWTLMGTGLALAMAAVLVAMAGGGRAPSPGSSTTHHTDR